MKFRFIYIIVISMCFLSCVKDRSTVIDYSKEISNIKIDNVAQNYDLESLGLLNIQPRVTPGNPDDYTYQWYLYSNADDNKLDDDKREKLLISTEPTLSYQVKVKSGEYTLLLKVRSKKTGLIANVSSKIGIAQVNGFIVLKNIDNNTDFDLITPSQEDRNADVFSNRIKSLLGNSLSGTPKSVDVIYSQAFLNPDSLAQNKEVPTFDNTLAITTSEDIKFLRLADLVNILPRKYMFYDDVDNFIPYRVVSMPENYYLYLFSNNGVQKTYLGGGGLYYRGSFSIPMSDGTSDNQDVIYGSNHVFMDINRISFVFWDDVNSRIRALSMFYPDTDSPITVDDSVKDKFTGLNADYDCLFAGCPVSGNDSYPFFLLQKKNDSFSRAICYMKVDGYTTFKVTNFEEISPDSKLAKAKIFSANNGGSINSSTLLYYITDNKLYAKSVDAPNQVEQEVPLEGISSSERLSYITNIYWKDKKVSDNNFDYLIIGTQNGSNYKLYFYTMVGGKPNGAPVFTSSGNGILSKVIYANSAFDKNNNEFALPLN